MLPQGANQVFSLPAHAGSREQAHTINDRRRERGKVLARRWPGCGHGFGLREDPVWESVGTVLASGAEAMPKGSLQQ